MIIVALSSSWKRRPGLIGYVTALVQVILMRNRNLDLRVIQESQGIGTRCRKCMDQTGYAGESLCVDEDEFLATSAERRHQLFDGQNGEFSPLISFLSETGPISAIDGRLFGWQSFQCCFFPLGCLNLTSVLLSLAPPRSFRYISPSQFPSCLSSPFIPPLQKVFRFTTPL